jgi:hypothetical protein
VSWAGVPGPSLAPALARLRLRRFRSEDGDVLVDLPRQPLPAADAPAPVRFLSTWEAVLLAHARRALVIREEDRPRIFHTKVPQSMNTFLVDGQVAGTWKHAGGRIEVEPFRPLGRADRDAVRDEAERLEQLYR